MAAAFGRQAAAAKQSTADSDEAIFLLLIVDIIAVDTAMVSFVGIGCPAMLVGSCVLARRQEPLAMEKALGCCTKVGMLLTVSQDCPQNFINEERFPAKKKLEVRVVNCMSVRHHTTKAYQRSRRFVVCCC